ncbi:MAG: DUF1328 domain-containing protein [Nanoarchaeota archaeon]|nr:DUF1328 domain-containing protein [Nanoarchaeota archaeon]
MVFGLVGWALTFFIIAVVAGLFGFGIIAGTSIAIAKLLFWVFVILFIIMIIVRAIRKI